MSRKIRSVISPDVAWHTAFTEKRREHVENVLAVELTGYLNRQALSGELIHDGQQPKGATLPEFDRKRSRSSRRGPSLEDAV